MTWKNEGPTVEIKRALVFALLMNDELLGKSPNYIMEKWATVNLWGSNDIELIYQMLHPHLRNILKQYIEKWNIDWEVKE